MKGYHRQTTAGHKQVNGLGQSPLQGRQFIIHGDA
jgi:hypothetical protein